MKVWEVKSLIKTVTAYKIGLQINIVLLVFFFFLLSFIKYIETNFVFYIQWLLWTFCHQMHYLIDQILHLIHEIICQDFILFYFICNFFFFRIQVSSRLCDFAKQTQRRSGKNCWLIHLNCLLLVLFNRTILCHYKRQTELRRHNSDSSISN